MHGSLRILVVALAALGTALGGCQESANVGGPEAVGVCPVSGKPADPDVTYVYQGKAVRFCCPDCIEAFKKDPAKYAAKLEEAKPEGSSAPRARVPEGSY